MASSSYSKQEHDDTVSILANRIREFHKQNTKFRIFHGSTNSTRDLKHDNIVDTSTLSHVLQVDRKTRTALVEPNVPMDRLVEATMRHGLVPPVVMEFPGITVGGGYAGTCGESSSFKHGFFDTTINYVETILADGEVVTCSKDERQDLFHGAAGALGTLGVTTLVELRLKRATQYVEATYHPASSTSEAITKIREATLDESVDYVDGIIFSSTHAAIITGRLTNTPSSKIRGIQRFSAATDPWFYLHVKDRTSSQSVAVTEAIPLADYLFRYDRGGFWVGASAFEYFWTPFNALTRWFLDDFLHTRMMYTALHASGQSRQYVVQDLALPYGTVQQFIEYTEETFNIYPLWLCPLRQSPSPTMHPHCGATQADGKTLAPMLNVGLWGTGPTNHAAFVALNRNLERKLSELGGMKWLYAHTYYTEEEFWTNYDRPWYERLREKYGAQGLTSVYEKVKVQTERGDGTTLGWARALLETWPICGFWGIWKAIRSGSYVEARASSWKMPPEIVDLVEKHE